MKSITCIKCSDCGLLWKKTDSLKEIGILDGNNCPNCGGEIVILNDDFTEYKKNKKPDFIDFGT